MPKSTAFSTDLVKLIFNGTAIDRLTTGTLATNLWMALHSGNPSEAGTQSSSEVSYAGYARQPLLRNAATWTVAADGATLLADVSFGENTAATSVNAQYVSIGLDQTGAGKILYFGFLQPQIVISQNTKPIVRAGTKVKEA